ncbi:MAG: SurA N-terminal domain-containing protein [Planctomycetota bacterium]|nr:SurA N-terminal domain-containing protein [Planctomycetota bacterium]
MAGEKSMALQWFRLHSKKFLWVTAIVVIPGMALFGATSFIRRGAFSGGGVVAASYRVNGRLYEISLARLEGERHVRNMCDPRYGGIDISDEHILHYYFQNRDDEFVKNPAAQGDGKYIPLDDVRDKIRQKLREQVESARTADLVNEMILLQAAADAGVRVTDDETRKEVTDAVRMLTGVEQPREETYRLVLQNRNISALDFERVARERLAIGKYLEVHREQGAVTGGEMYVAYCREKQKIRAMCKSFESAKYLDKVAEPSQDEIKKFYDEHKAPEGGSKPEDWLMTRPRGSVEYFYLAIADVREKYQPSEEQIEKHYRLIRDREYLREKSAPPPDGGGAKPKEVESGKSAGETGKDPAGDSAKQPPAGGNDESKYRPLNEVREDVIRRLRDIEGRRLAHEEFEKFLAQLHKDIEKAESEKKPLDLAACGKGKGFAYYRTGTHTADEFRAGKEEPGADDYRMAEIALRKYRKPGDRKFSPPDSTRDRNGYWSYRVVEYQEPRLKTLEEARADIVKRLKERAAEEMAKKAAEEAATKWAANGKDGAKTLPPWEEFEELIVDVADRKPDANRHPFARYLLYKGNTLPVGEISEVVDAAIYGDIGQKGRYLVGFILERKLPSREEFLKDSEWMSSAREAHETDRKNFIAQRMTDTLIEMSERVLRKVKREPRPLSQEPMEDYDY